MSEVDAADTCSVLGCEEGAIVDAEVEFGEIARKVHLCRRHLPLAMGGAILSAYLKPEVMEGVPQ